MPIPGSSFLGAVKQKLRKVPPAEELQNELQNGEGASPRFPTNDEPGTGDVPETIALAVPSPSVNPRGIHEIVSPFIDSKDSEPGWIGREAERRYLQSASSDQTDMANQSGDRLVADIGAISEAALSDQTDIAGQSGDRLVADIGAISEAAPLDQTDISGQSGNGLDAAFIAPATPKTAEKSAVEGLIGKSSPDSENGITALRELFAKKSVLNPAVKGLLERHQPVNTSTLNRELKQFARELGLFPPNG